MKFDRYDMKTFYIFDILEIEHELLDDCVTTQKMSDEDSQKMNAIIAGIKLMADKMIDEIVGDRK